MLRLYDYRESGNRDKVRLLLHQLEVPFERVEVEILAGENALLDDAARTVRAWLARVAGQPRHIEIRAEVGMPVAWPENAA